MSSFEDRLWQDLLREHGEEFDTVRRIRPRRRPALVAAAALAVVGSAAAVTFGGGVIGGTPAYAVDQRPDGSVTVTLREVAAADQTNAVLKERGIPIRVLPYKADCANTQSYPFDESAPETEFGDNNGAQAITIKTASVPPGDYAVINVVSDEHGEIAMMVLGGRPAKGEVPSCLRGDMASLGISRAPGR